LHTCSFCSFIVTFADKSAIVHQVELIPSGELLVALEAGKALEMIHVILSSPDNLCWRDGLLTTCTFGPEPSRKVIFAKNLTTSGITLVSKLYQTVSTSQALGMPRFVLDSQYEPVKYSSTTASTYRCAICNEKDDR
jgi:hypothetical protein